MIDGEERLAASTFNPNGEDLITLYLALYPDTGDLRLAGQKLSTKELSITLQIHLGINPENPSDIEWSYDIEYYMPSDWNVEYYVYHIAMKKVFFNRFSVPASTSSKIATIKVNRAIRMVLNNPHINIQESFGSFSDAQKDILNRLQIMAVYAQNHLLLGYDVLFLRKLEKFGYTLPASGHYFEACWSYTGTYNGETYTEAQFLGVPPEGGLPAGFVPVTIAEVQAHFLP
ncbi:MAG: hypothetical protein ACTSVZ_10165 [Promethearchaeota archaeon]